MTSELPDSTDVAVFKLFVKGMRSPITSREKTILLCYGMKCPYGFSEDELINVVELFGQPGHDYRTPLEEMVHDGYFEKTKPPLEAEKWVITQQGIDEYRHLDELSTFAEEPLKTPVHKEGVAASFKKAEKYFREVSARMRVGDPSAPIS